MRYDVYYFNLDDNTIHHLRTETDEYMNFETMIEIVSRWPEEAVICDEEGNEVFSKEEGRKNYAT